MKAISTAPIAKWGYPIASAVLMLLAFPPLHLRLLIYVALIPWLFSLAKEDARYAFRSGFVFGFVAALGQLYFMQNLVVVWTGSFGLSLVPYLICCSVYGLYHAFLGRAIWRAMQVDRYWLIPLLWAGLEVARSYIPGVAFPWGLLATPLYANPYSAQLAYFGTVYAVSAWVAAINVLWILVLRKADVKRTRVWAGVAIGLLIVGVIRANVPQSGTMTRFTAGQPGLDMAFSSQDDQDRTLAVTVPRLAEDAQKQGSRILILPEGLVLGGDSIPPETSFEVPQGIPVLFGGKRGRDPAHQTAFAYDGRWSYADKTRLVPFGEYVPGRSVFPGIAQAFQLPSGDIVAGTEVKPLTVAGIKIGALICFEGLFHDVAQTQADKGAQLLTVMCIDDWYFGTPAPEQLMSASVWRAIETGLPVIRVGGLGYTVAIDQRGKIIAQAPLKQIYPLEVNVKVPEKTTRFPLVRVFPWLAFAVFAVWALFGKRLTNSDFGNEIQEELPEQAAV